MATSNDDLRDALIRRQIYLTRFSSGLSRRVIELLKKTEADVLEDIEEAVVGAAAGAAISSRTLARLRVLRKALSTLRRSAWLKVLDIWDDELRQLASLEASYVAELFQEVSPVKLDMTLPSAVQLAAIVSTRPMEGAVLRSWASRMSKKELDAIIGAVNIGLTRGDNTQQIIARVHGTKNLGYSDGVFAISRKDAESITRTAVNYVSNQAKAALYLANNDIVSQEVYVATLDARTTAVCRSLDGKVFAVGRGPRPPLHWNCRSVRVALIDGRLIGSRPAVRATKQELDGLSQRERGKKVRELAGQVPAAQSYQEWLKGQTKAFQEDVLGKAKAKLFREGGLTLEKFVDRKGKEYTLKELRSREPEAFRKAGLGTGSL